MPEPPPWPAAIEVPSSDGVTLATYDLGGHGRDALFVHANGFCAAVFAPLATELHPWRRVALDARAHGASSAPSTDMAWEGHRDDVLATVDSYSLDGPIGVGHSMGGAALLLAEQAHPGTFAALWLFEPIVFPPMPGPVGKSGDSSPLTQGALKRRDTFDSAEAAYDNFGSKPPLDELCDECLAAYIRHGFTPTGDRDAVTLRCRPADEAAGYRMGIRHSAWDHLDEVSCPVVVARGADTQAGPALTAPTIAERLPRGTLEEHPKLGHFGPLADPAGVARCIRRVVDDDDV